MSERDEIPEVAIIGMAGRFPGARDLDTFWQNLCDGVESIRPLTDEDLAAAGLRDDERRDPARVRVAAVADDLDKFDAAFFGYSPREAELMDPQHRVFLECAFAALEDASVAGSKARGAVGVFGGASTNTYLIYNLASNPEIVGALDPMAIDVGNGGDFLATRVAYKLDLRGPSFTVQSGCSTSLLAVHVACQSLLSGECDMAIAGGVSFNVKHPEGYLHLPGGVASANGQCRAFDADADGTVFGSGAGVVVLKRVEDALRDGDPIRAVIKGSAANNDGALKVGYTAPSVDGQAAVIREALAAAGVAPETVGAIEAHGTATRLGDPIEVRALAKAFRAGKGAPRSAPCWIGSLKTNIGHISGAAGVAGLIKAALMLQRGQIPPSLHFDTPNPDLDLEATPFRVAAALTPWPARPGAPRRAGVSSFGVGGTNVHMVLEEAPPAPRATAATVTTKSPGPELLILSAKTRAALDAMTANLAGHMRAHPDLSLADVAHTLQVGRQPMKERRAVVCADREDALRALAAADGEAARLLTRTAHSEDRPVAFLFPGQGSQYVGMAREIYDTDPAFRRQIDASAEMLRPHLGLDLRAVLFPSPGAAAEAEAQFSRMSIIQPALFVVSHALAQRWMAWGIKPSTMLGHSAGEYVAACLAGVFSLPDALALIAARGRLMDSTAEGAMLSVQLPEAEIARRLPAGLSIAALNAPGLAVVSGGTAEIAAFEAQLGAEGVEVQRLRVPLAAHSPMMDPILAEFADRVSRLKLSPPQIPFISNVTGAFIEPAQATDPRYWARHLREPVRFADGLAALVADRAPILLEVGPGDTLGRLARSQLDKAHGGVVSTTRHARTEGSDVALMLGALGKIWLQGARVDWPAVSAGEPRRRVSLPTYPFARDRYWIEARRPGAPILSTGAGSDASSATSAAAPAAAPRRAEHARPDLDTPYVAPRNDLERAVIEVWQGVLGIEPIGAEDSFFDLGGHSLLAAQLRNQIHAALGVDLPLQSFFATPTAAAVATRIEEERRARAAVTDERPIAEQLRTAFPTDRQAILEGYLRGLVTRALPEGAPPLPEGGSLAAYDLRRLGAELEYDLRAAFKFQLYPHEVREHASIPDLARYLLVEMDRLADPSRFADGRPLASYPRRAYRPVEIAKSAEAPVNKAPPIVFVHSSPRAGSTLFRVMLAGHPQLFCPPEVNLLFFEDARQWRANIGFGHEMEWTTGGLQWAFVELLGIEPEAGRAFVDDLVARNVRAEDIYRQLSDLSRPRLLVDKTPSYSLDLPTLRRAEEIFDAPRHIFLYRHPFAVMESIIKLRLDRIFAKSLFGSDEVDPYVVAETVWALCNRNVLDFLSSVPKGRAHLVRYEDLVRDPDAVMRGVARFLDLPFDQRMLEPYDGKRERMMGGLGDPNIMAHKGIDKNLGDAWRRVKWPRRLDPSTIAVMERLGYELPDAPANAPQKAAPTSAEEAERLLANLDGLSDEQVAALLAEMSDPEAR